MNTTAYYILPRRARPWRHLLGLALGGIGLSLAAPAPVAAMPAIQHWQTGNGVQVLFVETHQLPIVDIQVVFDAGSARDGGHAGVSRLTNTLIDEGAGNLNVEQIAERFDRVGAEYSSDSQRDMATVSLRSLTDEKLLKPALDTLATILQDPAFPKESFERERQRMLVALRQQEESPGDIAEKRFYAALYGDHPYATEPLGTVTTLKAMTRDAVTAFHKQYYVAANALVVIVGDVEQKRAADIADTLMSKLPQGSAPPPIPPAPPLAASRTVEVPYTSTQTHVLAGQVGITRKSPDYFPLYVGNHVLGGNGLVSLLADEVREKRGLSYSTYSYFEPLLAKGPFVMGLQTRNNKVDEAIKVMVQTLRDFMAEGPTAKRLKEAKENITGGFPLRIDSNAKIAAYLALIGFYDLPLDYLKTFNDHVEKVSVADINRAFAKHVHPDRMLTVVVGGGAKTASLK